jgi:hypothetical protein
MNLSIDLKTEAPLPNELKAVLLILRADETLRSKALSFVDIDRRSIDWEKIFSNDYSGGHMAALVWAKAIWCDEVTTKSDPFDRAFSMNPPLQRAVLEALAIRWSLI